MKPQTKNFQILFNELDVEEFLSGNSSSKRAIDQSSCNKDFSCLKGFCPSFLTLEGAKVKKGATRELDLPDLPQPELPAINGTHNVVITGVGGTGVVNTLAVPIIAHWKDTALADLAAAIADMDAAIAAEDLEAWAEADERFHVELVRLGGNSRVQMIVAMMGDQVRRAKASTLFVRPLPVQSNEDHRQVYAAILAGDPAKARRVHRDEREPDTGARQTRQTVRRPDEALQQSVRHAPDGACA